MKSNLPFTMAAKKQINVGLSGEIEKKFNELKEAYYMTSDAELCRMAINRMYADWKREREELLDYMKEELEPMVQEILEKREGKK